jgi:NAD(P)-dependent dehydrogenase (short-subunit alcohol dehydrogenase family)
VQGKSFLRNLHMLNPMDMTGRRIMITGASSGIGRETAILLSQLGAKLVLVARDASRLEETRSLLEGGGHRVEPFDLAALDDIPSWMGTLGQEFGTLSGLWHCAGIQMTLPLHLITTQHIAKITNVNLSAAIILVKGLSQKGVLASSGSVVLMSSVMGLVGSPARSLYSATKGALVALTKSLALELAGDGIRVNCIAPAFVESPMFEDMKKLLRAEGLAKIESAHPLGIGRPRDIANAVAFLLADTGRWITGTTLVVDGGYTAQ